MKTKVASHAVRSLDWVAQASRLWFHRLAALVTPSPGFSHACICRALRHGLSAALPALLLAGTLLGCNSGGARLKLTSFKDPYFPEHYTLDLTECVYRVGPGGDLHVAGRAETRDDRGRPLTRFLHVRVYWQPQPGKTPADASATNALLRYVVSGADGVAVYAGTSFAFPKYVRGDRLRLSLEKGRLLPQTTSGSLPEFLGSTSLAGRLLANPDPGATAQLVREMDLLAPH